jgi:hypothetical protein
VLKLLTVTEHLELYYYKKTGKTNTWNLAFKKKPALCCGKKREINIAK